MLQAAERYTLVLLEICAEKWRESHLEERAEGPSLDFFRSLAAVDQQYGSNGWRFHETLLSDHSMVVLPSLGVSSGTAEVGMRFLETAKVIR
jgi:hypothetical protein